MAKEILEGPVGKITPRSVEISGRQFSYEMRVAPFLRKYPAVRATIVNGKVSFVEPVKAESKPAKPQVKTCPVCRGLGGEFNYDTCSKECARVEHLAKALGG